MTSQRARNLSASDVAVVVSMLDLWTGPLSWNRLIDAINLQLSVTYTRQALHKHGPIAEAFRVRKSLSEMQTVAGEPLEFAAMRTRIGMLEGEVARLGAQNDALLHQFARWAYNAHTRGLDRAFLDRPLLPVDRGRSSVAPTQTFDRSIPDRRRV